MAGVLRNTILKNVPCQEFFRAAGLKAQRLLNQVAQLYSHSILAEDVPADGTYRSCHLFVLSHKASHFTAAARSTAGQVVSASILEHFLHKLQTGRTDDTRLP